MACSPVTGLTVALSPQRTLNQPVTPGVSHSPVTFIIMLSFRHRVTFRKHHSDRNLPHVCRNDSISHASKRTRLQPLMEILKERGEAQQVREQLLLLEKVKKL